MAYMLTKDAAPAPPTPYWVVWRREYMWATMYTTVYRNIEWNSARRILALPFGFGLFKTIGEWRTMNDTIKTKIAA